MKVVKQIYGEKVLVQYEDFANHDAFELLVKYGTTHLVFNDDIQGTAVVVLAGLVASLKLLEWSLVEHTFLFFGAGEAGTGIAEIIALAISKKGYHGDTSKTFFCGDVSESIKRLVKVTEECLHYGSAVCRDGALYRKIGKRISEHAEKFGYGVVDRFVGHGIGTVFHSEPLIFHHRNDKSGSMVEGQTFTIEPILTLGSTECVTWEDNWTTLTADGSPAAQFEHTILITKTGAEILTTY